MRRLQNELQRSLQVVSCLSQASACQRKQFQSTLSAKTAPSRASEPPIELLHVIRQHIRAHGPLPLDRYMRMCLQHPTLGYYTRTRQEHDRAVLGKAGDFITSPEISQVFGELVAIWFITQWQAQGSAAKVRIIELGPGKGTLMEDMLRTFRRIKSFPRLAAIELIESSQHMRQLQETRLKGAIAAETSMRWHANLSEVAEAPHCFTMIIAHEFFDALPIHLFERRNEGWREVMVDNSSLSTGPPLRLAVSPGATLASGLYTKHPRYQELMRGGARAEICPDGYTIAGEVGKILAASQAGGAALIVDYGDEKIFGSSLRAFKDHKLVDPLEQPGQADLTANVDFGWLKNAIEEHAQSTPILTQQEFLMSLGISIRLEQLLKSAPAERHEDIKSATNRLIDATSMGTQYRMLAVVPKERERPFPFSQLNSPRLSRV